MEDVVSEVLGDADPNNRDRFAILSSNFDRALNAMYQPRSDVTGGPLAELSLAKCYRVINLWTLT